jgi:hypothetical protein
MTRRDINRCRAFTLAEMALSLAMFGLLAVAIQSAVLLAARAVPNPQGVTARQLGGSNVVDQIATELSNAVEVSELAPSAVTFKVGDRNGDAEPETVRYSWDGSPDGVLRRRYNNGAEAIVLEGVNEFQLGYQRRMELCPPTYTDAPETLLYSYTGALSPVAFPVDDDDWCGQYFVPTLPNGTESWRLTRVQFQARRAESGKMRVQLRTATGGGLPTTVVIDQAEVDGGTYGSNWAWREVSLANAGGLAPAQPVCVVFRGLFNNEDCEVQYQTLSLALGSGARFFSSSNAGSSFTANTLRAMPLRVYGRAATKDPDQYRHYLTNVSVALRCGPASASRVVTEAAVLAEPEVSAP